MGLRAAEWAASLPLRECPKPSTRSVLVLLGIRSTDPGYAAYPSIATLAELLDVDRRTIQRALADLTAQGLIRPGDPHAVRHLRADRRPGVYDVLTPELVERELRPGARWAS